MCIGPLAPDVPDPQPFTPPPPIKPPSPRPEDAGRAGAEAAKRQRRRLAAAASAAENTFTGGLGLADVPAFTTTNILGV